MKIQDVDYSDAEWSIFERKLPHWIQAGVLCFVTWRLADSLPKFVIDRLEREIAEILRSHELDARTNWKNELATWDVNRRGRFQWKLFAARERFFDLGHGACWLAKPEFSAIVAESLKRFDNDRYFLTDFVVMPNHVHFIAAFPDESFFLKQNSQWKRYTAREINKRVGRSGQFWQTDQFDHLIRSEEQFQHYRRYIAKNPKQAKLSSGMYRLFQKELE